LVTKIAVNNNLRRNCTTGGFFRLTQIFFLFDMPYTNVFNRETFYYGDVLLWRRFVTGDVLLRRRSITETLCYGDVLYGDVLSRRRFVRRRFVCAPKSCRPYADPIVGDLDSKVWRSDPDLKSGDHIQNRIRTRILWFSNDIFRTYEAQTIGMREIIIYQEFSLIWQ
jgi:hypothetical protein